ncbi:Ribosome biogenesis protein erb1 [Cryptotrichosporon argae]
MAPRASAVASSSRAPAGATASRVALPFVAATTKAKRPAAPLESDDDEFAAVGELDLSEDDEAGDDEDEDDDGEDDFPELDSGSDGEVNGDASGEDNDADTEDEVVDDEATGSESGYNTSDIEALYSGDSDADDDDDDDDAESPATSPSSSTTKLDRLIRKHTVKPDDRIGADEKISVAKEGKGKLVPSKLVEGGYRREYDEIEAGYGSESSTEDNPNTVGNIPMEWYDDLPHIGYDVNGRKIFRPARGDELDKFLANVTDVAAWTSAEDKAMQQAVQLSDKELDIIRRLERAENPDADYDPYQPTIEWFTGEGRERAVPLSGAPEPKRRFVPSKWEHQKVMKIVKAIREGRIVPNAPAKTKPSIYSIWAETDAHVPHAMYMPAPQLPPPTTGESYNPPEEYLPTAEEQAAFDALDREDRKTDFLPQKYNALRLVPAYRDTVRERFERALDLYLAPRTRRVKLNIDPESLIPKLPAPRELRPFPTAQAVQYRHPGATRVRAVSLSPAGEWLASGSEDGVVRLWDMANGREVWRWDLGRGAVQYVEWSPNADEALLVALVDGRAAVLAPLALVDPRRAAATLDHANAAFASSAASTKEDKNAAVKWARPGEYERERGVLVYVEVPGTPKQVAWHRKGDYFATVATEAANQSVLIHQLSKHATQSPFRKTPGQVQRVSFHPSRPHFFAATQRYVRVYDLAAQTLLRTLQTGVKWVSALDVHPSGDHVLVGAYDKKLAWFDMDLGTRPYRTLRYHARALRAVAYHRVLPLFASASDDGTIHVFHSTVYSDFDRNPLIVPLKILRGHAVTDGLGVLDLCWHPEKPWLVSSGADGECRLWTS